MLLHQNLLNGSVFADVGAGVSVGGVSAGAGSGVVGVVGVVDGVSVGAGSGVVGGVDG